MVRSAQPRVLADAPIDSARSGLDRVRSGTTIPSYVAGAYVLQCNATSVTTPEPAGPRADTRRLVVPSGVDIGRVDWGGDVANTT